MYLLDTNIVSELRKSPSGKADLNVVQWASTANPETLYISSDHGVGAGDGYFVYGTTGSTPR